MRKYEESYVSNEMMMRKDFYQYIFIILFLMIEKKISIETWKENKLRFVIITIKWGIKVCRIVLEDMEFVWRI